MPTRREVLGALPAVAAAAAGCLGSGDDDVSGPIAGTTTSVVLSAGEWYAVDDLEVTARNPRVRTELEVTGSDATMPDGEKMALVDLAVRNTASAWRYLPQPVVALYHDAGVSYFGDRLLLPEESVAWSRVYPSMETPDYDEGGPERLESGQTFTGWVGWLVPSSFSFEGARVGFDADGDGTYRIRWTFD